MKFFFNRKAHNVFKAIGDVRKALGAQQYIATDEIATVMFLAERLGKPVLTEGPAGVGKTELAKAWAAASGRGALPPSTRWQPQANPYNFSALFSLLEPAYGSFGDRLKTCSKL